MNIWGRETKAIKKVTDGNAGDEDFICRVPGTPWAQQAPAGGTALPPAPCGGGSRAGQRPDATRAPSSGAYLVGALPVQLLLALVPLHELLHEGDCHPAVLQLGPTVLILDGWRVRGRRVRGRGRCQGGKWSLAPRHRGRLSAGHTG